MLALAVYGLQNLVLEQGGVVGVVGEESLDFGYCVGAIVATEQSSHPIAWEEDVARALYSLKLLKTRVYIC